MTTELRIEWLGTVPYAEALERQRKCVDARRAGAGPDTLLLLEHPPVITLGRSAHAENLRLRPEALARRGIEVHSVSRGGDVTLHAPGQLVGYLIADLEARGRDDVHVYLRGLEASLGEAAEDLGVRTRTIDGYTGLFSAVHAGRPRKLASIGVGLRGWVSYHGFALNVDIDLSLFDSIVPCGLRGVEMTSLARELGALARPNLAERAREAVSDVFARDWC